MNKAKIISGKYEGLYGECTNVNSYGNVMFYPNNSSPVYRVCLRANEIEFFS